MSKKILCAFLVTLFMQACASSLSQLPKENYQELTSSPSNVDGNIRKKSVEIFQQWSSSVVNEKITANVPADAWIKLFKSILDKDDKFMPALYNKLLLDRLSLQLNERDEKEIKDMKYLLSVDDHFFIAQENLISLERINESLDSIKKYYEILIEKNNQSFTAKVALAKIYLFKKDYNRSLELCREVLYARPRCLEAYRLVAQNNMEQGKLAIAKLVIFRGLSLFAEDEVLLRMWAELLWMQGENDSAVDKFHSLLKIYPDNQLVHAYLGSIALKFYDGAAAKKHFSYLVKVNPKCTLFKIYLASAELLLRNFENSIQSYEAILKENNYDTVIGVDLQRHMTQWGLAWQYVYYKKKYDEAIYLLQIIEKETSEPSSDFLKIISQKQITDLLLEANKQQEDRLVNEKREKNQQRIQQVLSDICTEVAQKKKPDASLLGNETLRQQVAWEVFIEGQKLLQDNQKEFGENRILCALALLPDTPASNKQACAPMYVIWTQILYQQNRLDEVKQAISQAALCDADNEDVKLILKQLEELASAQSKTEPSKTFRSVTKNKQNQKNNQKETP